jgi:hypothetical protein
MIGGHDARRDGLRKWPLARPNWLGLPFLAQRVLVELRQNSKTREIRADIRAAKFVFEILKIAID